MLLVSGVGVNNVQAASSGLTVSPTSASAEVAPGASYKGEMLVINQSELDYSYKVYATPYSVNGEDYQPYFSPIKGAIDASKWFTFDSTGNAALKIGDQDTIPFTVSVPKGTLPGSYYATVFAETADKGSSGVVTRKRVGMVVYIRVSGAVVEKGSVAAWNVSWIQEAPFAATVKIANEGSVYFQSKVNVVVSDLFGGKKFTYERDPNILPQKLRSMPVSWENGATFGLFKVDGTVTYLGRTDTLPTKIVFIANTPMRIVTVGMLLAFVAFVVFLSRRRAEQKK